MMDEVNLFKIKSFLILFVYFLQIESVMWLNELIKKLWFFIEEMIKDIIKECIEFEIQKNFILVLKIFFFDKIELG